MDDQLDVPLEDPELLAEVELTTDLMIAATSAEHLPQSEVDRLLGLDVRPRLDASLHIVGEQSLHIPVQKERRAG